MNEFRLTMYIIKGNTKLVSNAITNLLMQLIFLNWIIILRQMGTFPMIHFNVKVLVTLLTRTLYEYTYFIGLVELTSMNVIYH